MNTPGTKFRQAIADSNPLLVVGAVNAYCAKMAESAGHKALYLSGAGVANASFGLPDLAITTLNDGTISIGCWRGQCFIWIT